MALKSSPLSFSQEFPRRITVLRFPLLLLIIAIHAGHGSQLPELGPDSFFNSAFWRLFPHSAVPFFFLISGVFITLKLGDTEPLSCRNFFRQRFFSLLIPYVLWNLIMALPHLILPLLFRHSSLLPETKFPKHELLDVLLRIYGLNDNPPIDVPLWYIRNLLLFCMLAPLLVTPLRKLPVWATLLIALALDLFHPVSGSSYFILGMMLGLRKPELSWIDHGCLLWMGLAAALPWLTPLVSQYRFASIQGDGLLWTFFCFFSALFFFAAGGWLLRTGRFTLSWLIRFGGGTFFAYCLHAPVATTLTRLFIRLTGNRVSPVWLFWLNVALTTFLCYLTYVTLRRFAPSLFAMLNGHRHCRRTLESDLPATPRP